MYCYAMYVCYVAEVIHNNYVYMTLCIGIKCYATYANDKYT